MTKQWFDVDRAGLGRQAEEHGNGNEDDPEHHGIKVG